MGWLKLSYVAGGVASVAAHFAAFGGLAALKKPEPGSQNIAVMMSQQKKKEKPKPPEPPKPIEAPKDLLERPLAPRHAAAPPPVAPPAPDPIAAAHPQMAALPDFGISLSGSGPPGAGGIAIPTGGGATPASAQPTRKEKVLGVAAERTSAASDSCTEDLVKAKAQGFVKATYTDDARAAGIEGRVRVEIAIDETGKVQSAKIVSGLGHGLDESAVEAAKRMAFSPATRCGSAVRSTFVVSMRFVLGE